MAYQLSRHNITGSLKDSGDFYIVNPLSRNADIISAEKYHQLKTGDWNSDTESQKAELVEKGYLVIPEEEEKKYRQSYLDFLDNRENDEIQLFYVPTYACNFSCTYCYQEGYDPLKGSRKQESLETVKAFFSYIDKEFAGKRIYVTVFGGEPLLPGEGERAVVKTIIDEANKRNLGLAFVTNGYTLESYIPLLKTARIREIQITLDGLASLQDKRRPLHGGGHTFDVVSRGIDLALEEGFAVNLRAVMDRENMGGLADLAAWAIERGWTDKPLFKTQLGRNYELHFCQSDQNKLYTRVEMYEAVYSEIKKNPHIMKFHEPAFSLSHFLWEQGELPDPLFDSCPACKTEWAFDYTGRIYSCTATVGKKGEELGTFYPEVFKDVEKIESWSERDVTIIPECRNCSLQLACGGGCAAVAKNQEGSSLKPDCRPVDALMGLGLSLYFGNEENAGIEN